MPILKFKNFLRFYGTHPENFDKETQDWIASTPPDKLRRDLQKYRAAVGVDYYNLDLKSAVVPAPEGGLAINTRAKAGLDEMRQFYLKYMGGPIRYIDKDGKERQSITYEAGVLASVMVYAPQSTYRRIIDKAISGEAMTENEMKHINQPLSGGEVRQEYSQEQGRHIFRRTVYFGPFGIIKALYEFVLDIANRRVDVHRCAAEDCNNIFIPYKSGQGQRFCSARCRSRVHKRQKASVDA